MNQKRMRHSSAADKGFIVFSPGASSLSNPRCTWMSRILIQKDSAARREGSAMFRCVSERKGPTPSTPLALRSIKLVDAPKLTILSLDPKRLEALDDKCLSFSEN